MEFFETVMGRRFYEGTMPKIADRLMLVSEEIHELKKEIARSNDLKEAELKAMKEKSAEEPIVIRNTAASIVDSFDDLLFSKGIMIPNEDREGDEGEAAIYAGDFDQLCDEVETELQDILIEAGVKEERIVKGVLIPKEKSASIESLVVYVPAKNCFVGVTESTSGIDREDEKAGYKDSANVELIESVENNFDKIDGGVMLLRDYFSSLYPATDDGADRLAKDAVNFILDGDYEYVVITRKSK